MRPKQLVVMGDSGVLGWGDRLAGGWCERLRLSWMQLPEAPVVYPLGVRGDGLERVNARWRTEWACRGELRRKVPDDQARHRRQWRGCRRTRRDD